MKYKEAIYRTNELIKSIQNDLIKACKSPREAQQQAIWILEEIIQKKQIFFFTNKKIELNIKQAKKLNDWIYQIITKKKPLQYIIGSVPFLNLKIKTKPPILIPRPETEEWVNWLIKKLKRINNRIRILDIGTGSGCISLSLAKNLPNSFVTGIDINSNAIELAKENKEINKIKNIQFIVSDFYKNLNPKYKFDIIVGNPPYICEKEWTKLDETIKNWEDKNALVAKEHCLHAYDVIVSHAKFILRKNTNLDKINSIFLEIGAKQGPKLKLLFEKNGLKNIYFLKDTEKKERVISARF